MARYDYGLRGSRETIDPRFANRNWRAYGSDIDLRTFRSTPRSRVTARYNLDYVQPGAELFRFSHYRFAGDSNERIGDERAYRHPFMTRGGTRTSREAPHPSPYDYRDYGPAFGGRYPDEL